MLNSHPDLAMPHETQFVVKAWRRRDAFGDLSSRENREAVARWVLELPKTAFGRLEIEPDDLVKRFADAGPTIGSLMAAPFRMYAENHGKVRWGDKRPSYARNLAALLAMFPEAQYIHLTRDPRACVASMRGAWASWGQLASAVDIWGRTDQDGLDAVRKLRPDQVIAIRYEDLLADPATVLGQLCDFLQLDRSGLGRMLNYHDGSAPLSQLHTGAAEPLDPERLNKWKHELKPEEIAFIEQILGDRIDQRGYQRSGAHGSIPALFYADLKKVAAERDKEERTLRLIELKRKVTYRQDPAMR